MTWKSSSALVLAVLLMFGCRTAPIANIKDSQIPTSSGEKANMQTIEQAIVWAGLSLGWQMEILEPGLIVGKLNLRSHEARVEIPYSTESYSILYKSSVNLNQRGETIHRAYNRWVRHLDRAIKNQLDS